MKSFYLIAILLFYSLLGCSQTSWQFAQFQLDPYMLNPAAAGIQPCHTVTIGHRRQYTTLERAMSTSIVAYNMSTEESGLKKFKKGWHGFGGLAVEDRFGSTSSFTFSGAYSYHLRLQKDHVLSAGTFLTVNRLAFQTNQARLKDQNDPAFEYAQPIYLFPLFTPGIAYSSPTWYLSLSVWNLFKSKMSGFRNSIGSPADLERMIYLGAQKTLIADDYNSYHIGGQVRYTGMALPSMDIQAGWTFDQNFTTMLGYRVQDAVIGSIQFRFLRKFKFGYAYEYNLSAFSAVGQHTHEIAITINSCFADEPFDPRRYCPAYAKAH